MKFFDMVELLKMSDNPQVDREKPKPIEERVREKVAVTIHSLLNESAVSGKDLLKGIERSGDDGKTTVALMLIYSSASRLPELRKLEGEILLSEMKKWDDFRLSVHDPNLPIDYTEVEFYRFKFEPYSFDEAYTKEPPTKSMPFGNKRGFKSDNEALAAFEKAIDAFNAAKPSQ